MRTKPVKEISVAIVTGFAAAVLLTACSNPIDEIGNNLAEAGTEKLTEELTGADVDLDFDGSGASLPDDWPSDVVLPDGKIMLAMSLDDGQMVQVAVSGPEAFDELVSNLEGAGFVEGESLDNEVMSIRIFERDGLGASASMIDLDGEYVLQVTLADSTS